MFNKLFIDVFDNNNEYVLWTIEAVGWTNDT